MRVASDSGFGVASGSGFGGSISKQIIKNLLDEFGPLLDDPYFLNHENTIPTTKYTQVDPDQDLNILTQKPRS